MLCRRKGGFSAARKLCKSAGKKGIGKLGSKFKILMRGAGEGKKLEIRQPSYYCESRARTT